MITIIWPARLRYPEDVDARAKRPGLVFSRHTAIERMQEISARFDRSVPLSARIDAAIVVIATLDRGIHLLAKRPNPKAPIYPRSGIGVRKSDHPSCVLKSVPDAS
jgi:hypothetical protein